MRPRRLATVALLAALGALPVGCIDLFHSFDDLANACGSTEACEAGAGVPETRPTHGHVGTDFCAWSRPEARAKAEHACAWLGACESPLGHNRFAECMVDAILAFDCAANPSMPVRGALRDYWASLANATSCAGIYGATNTAQSCEAAKGTFSFCLPADGAERGAFEGSANTRVECLGASARAGGERCLARGQACASRLDPAPSMGSCVGSTQTKCGLGCDGTLLHACVDGGADLGLDCRYFGGGKCVVGADSGACAPAEGGSSCARSDVISCSGTVARVCRTGTLESVDCAALGGKATCTPRTLARHEPLAAACSASLLLDSETCAGGAVVSRARGIAQSVRCSDVGLGPCRMVDTLEGKRAACTAR